MNLSLADARSISWWEYSALLVGHQPPEDELPPEAPDADFVRRRMERLADAGMIGSLH
jgi:hypothetical protein